MALWAKMEGATPLGHVAGVRFPAGFAHVASSYGAGYYAYLWSLVQAMGHAHRLRGRQAQPPRWVRATANGCWRKGSQKAGPAAGAGLPRPALKQPGLLQDLKR